MLETATVYESDTEEVTMESTQESTQEAGNLFYDLAESLLDVRIQDDKVRADLASRLAAHLHNASNEWLEVNHPDVE
jgi:acetyl-CoA carboxylase carboxyltransferase component